MRWFMHDAGSRNDRKLWELNVKHGSDGYKIFFCFLELQAEEEGPVKLTAGVAASFMLQEKRVREVVASAVELGLFDKAQWKNGFVFSPNLEARADNYSKRKKREEDTQSIKPQSELAEWCSKIEEAWHKTKLPKIVNWSAPRKDKLSLRLKNEYFKENVIQAIEKMGASAFCNGTNDRKWTATIDFLIANDNNFVKALEGRYDDRGNEVDSLMKKYGVPIP